MIDTSRDLLAKLLAEENIEIEHKKVSTACFDPDSRVLTMPIWNDIDPYTHVMMISHECGHALYSPTFDHIPEELNKTYVNVVEDARIDKLIKRKYPGLAKDYHFGYRYLIENNFFGTVDKNIDEYPFIDRINLYFKGSPLVYFNPKEREIVSKVEQVETFEEVIELVRIITEYIKENPQKKVNTIELNDDDLSEDGMQLISHEDNDENDSEDESPTSNTSQDISKESEESGDAEESDNHEDTENNTSNRSDNSEQQLEDSLTDTAWQRNMSMLINDKIKRQLNVSIPKINYGNYITEWKTVYRELKITIENYLSPSYEKYVYNHPVLVQAHEVLLKKYILFKKSSITSVNYLVKEFEMKKAADSYSRSRISKTGVINTNKLYSYQWNEDIFKKVVNIPEGKNHGLIMFLDWSGSMDDKLVPTVKQLFNLIWFCRKVNIPYDIYTFTSNIIYPDYQYSRDDYADNSVAFDTSLRLVQLFNSSMNNIITEEQMRNVWILANNAGYTKQTGIKQISFPMHYNLGSTPLNETIITTKYIAELFQKKNKVQKLHFIYLTDGEGAPLYINSSELSDEIRYGSRRAAINISSCHMHKAKVILKDRNNEWDIPSHPSHVQAEVLLKWLKTYFPSSNTISIRLSSDHDARCLAFRFDNFWEDTSGLRTNWKKEGFYSVVNKFGFNKDFIIRFNQRYTADLDSQEMNVDSNASKTMMTKQFTKHLKNRMQSKLMLKSFIETIV